MKMEMECKLLAGSESKAFLVDLTDLTKRLEKVARLLRSPSEVEAAESEESEDEEKIEAAPKTKRGRPAKAAAPIDEDEESGDSEDAESEEDELEDSENSDDEASFDESEDEEPKKTKSKKAPSVKRTTIEQVNEACLALAKATKNRKLVVSILEKVGGVKTVSDLKEPQFDKVIAALVKKMP